MPIGGTKTDMSQYAAGVPQPNWNMSAKYQGWFGPNAPMAPVAPRPQVVGRRFDYPIGANQQLRPRTFEGVSFETLRALSDAWDILRLIIETRKDQIARLTWRIRPKLDTTGVPMTTPNDPMVKTLIEFFESPDQETDWDVWLRSLLEDLFVLDAPTLYSRTTNSGKPYSFEPIDGGTIKRIVNLQGRTPLPPDPAYQQIIKGMPAVDYTTDEIIYRPRNVRTNKIYGFGQVEQILQTVSVALKRNTHVSQYYTEGNVPDAFIGVPETWTPDHIRAFQEYWDDLLSGETGERRHARFVPGGVKYIPTKEVDLKAQFDEWLARVACYCFSINPQPFITMVNRATAGTANQTAKEEGQGPTKQWVSKLVNFIIRTRFKRPDLEFSWLQQEDVDPKQAAEVRKSDVSMGIRSLNSIREQIGERPLPGLDVPMVFTPQGFVPVGWVLVGNGTLLNVATGEVLGAPLPTDNGGGSTGGAKPNSPTDESEDAADSGARDVPDSEDVDTA